MSLEALLNDIPISIMVTGALVAVAGSLLGTFLVLRRASMLSDAISHSIVFGIAVVYLIFHVVSGPVQIIGAALTGVLTVFLVQSLTSTGRVKSDAAIGLVFPALFSAGVLLLNIYARDVHVDAHTVLLGEIGFVWLDTVGAFGMQIPRSLLTMAVVTLVNLTFVLLFFKELKLMSFDSGLARALGFLPGVLFYALLSLTSVTAVAAFDAVGVILFVAFVIVPPAAAYLLTDRLPLVILYACLMGIAASILGYWQAVAWNVSIGGSMALVTGYFLLAAVLLSPRYGLVAAAVRRRQNRRRLGKRAIVVHLYSHEGLDDEEQESRPQVLQEHLRWSEAQAHRSLRMSLDDGLVSFDGQRLHLTDKGRELARDILEPWQRA